MGNRIVGNVYILDAGSANQALPWPRDAKVNSVLFYGNDTSAEVILTDNDTTNAILRIKVTANGNIASTQSVYLGGVNFPDILKVPTLTAGTAWIYFV